MTERDLTARIRVERDGDTGAMRELADDFRSLESPAREAGDAVEDAGRDFASFDEELREARETLREVREDFGTTRGDVVSLSDAFDQRLPKASASLRKVQAAVEAFRESFNATREVIDFIEAEFGLSIDQMVTDALRLEELGEQIVNFFRGSGEASAELLRNQQKIFENLGLEGLSGDVERNAAIIEQHFRSIGETVSQGSQFLSRYGLEASEATEKAKTFATEFSAALEVNPDIDLSELKERVGGQIEGILEDLKGSGAEIPQEFAAIVERLNEIGGDLDFSKSLESLRQFQAENERLAELRGAEELKNQVVELLNEYARLGENAPAEIEKIAEAMGVTSSATGAELEKISGLLGLLPGETKTNVDAIVQAWESLDPEQIRQRFRFLDDEQKEELRERFREVVATIKAGGGEISQEMASLGSSIGVLTSAWEPVGSAADSAADRLVQAARRGAEGIAELGTSTDAAAGEVAAGSSAAAESITAWVTKVNEAGQEVKQVETITAEAALKMTLAELESADPRLKEYVKALKEAQKGLSETKTSADAAGEALGQPASQAGELGAGVEQLATASKNLKKADGGSAASELAKGLNEIATAAGDSGAAEKIAEIKTSLDGLNEWDNSAILGKIQAVTQALNEAATAARNLDSATEGGGGGEGAA